MLMVHLCPVCRGEVKKTTGSNIPGHLDSNGSDICPGSHEPFRITVRQEAFA
ncbi:MAG: hypothetical protein GX868_15500 [Actinobacteria bacterium]|nr:hypothetical protein [Actinomycetota bacterium]